MTSPALTIVKPQDYFASEVSRAISSLKSQIDDHTEHYLVKLLCDYIEPQNIEIDGAPTNVMDAPMAFILKAALEAPPSARAGLFKRLGDTTLYFAGFFQDYFNRKTFDIGYYIAMGQSAYVNLADLMSEQSSDKTFAQMFRGLAENFVSCVDIVAEVSEGQGPKQNVDILATYDRWMHSNSARLRKILQEEGITPIQTPYKIAQ